MVRFDRRRLTTLTLSLTLITLTYLLFTFGILWTSFDHVPRPLSDSTHPREIYATLLTGHKNDFNETDNYYNATRVLVHRLLINPQTRDSRPIVVFVTPDVAEYKRQRLTRDGAIVREIPTISFLQAIGDVQYDWIKNDSMRLPENQGARVFRWKDQMTKLQLFGMIEYDKIAYLDSDVLPLSYIGNIFTDSRPQFLDSVKYTTDYSPTLEISVDDDPSRPENVTHTTHTVSFRETLSDYGFSPASFYPYVFYAVSDPGGTRKNETGPPRPTKDLNAGMMVFSPSKEHHARLMSLAKQPHLWNYGLSMEQDLLRLAFNSSGKFPWSPLDWRYNGLWAKKEDLALGTATIHGKTWSHDTDTEFAMDSELKSLFWRALGQVEEYWRVRDNVDSSELT